MGFFKDTDIGYNTFGEKLGWIFEQLKRNVNLNPEQIPYEYYSFEKNKGITVKISRDLNIQPNCLKTMSTIDIPTKWLIELNINIEDEQIVLQGLPYKDQPEFEYKLPVDMITEITNRLKKKKIIK